MTDRPLVTREQAQAWLADGPLEAMADDVISAIHQHMGHDGQSDEANDWVGDLWSAIAALVMPSDLAATVVALHDEVERIEDDLTRALRVRNEALLAAAEELHPGPDGQDYLDREALIREWVDDGHERVDAMNAKQLECVQRVARLRTVLADVLGCFTERGHPGHPCLRTGWQDVEQVAEWRAALGGGS